MSGMNITIMYDGGGYVFKNGEPEEGDLVMFKADSFGITEGKVYEIEEFDFDRDFLIIDDDGDHRLMGRYSDNYLLLTPVEDAEDEVVPETFEYIIEALASLSTGLTKLRRDINVIRADMAYREDVEEFAQTASQAEMTAKKAEADTLALAYDVDALKRTEMERRK